MARGRWTQLSEILTGPMHRQHPARVADFIAHLDAAPAEAAKIASALEAGDMDTVFKVMAEQQWGRATARPQAPAAPPSGSRQPIPFEQRVANDPRIRRAIDDAQMSPELRAKVAAGDPEAIMEAYRGTFSKGGRGRPKATEDSIRELAKPADQVAAENIGRQFDRALIPYGGSPGVSVGGVRGPGVPVDAGTELIPAPLRGLPVDPSQSRSLTVADRPYRIVDEVPSRKPFPTKRALGAAAAVGAGVAMMGGDAKAPGAKDMALTESGNPADLQGKDYVPFSEETLGGLPPEDMMKPVVAPPPKPVDYSLQARALINRLNDMRRAAGREVPEAPKMMAEINRLIALGNEQRRNPQYSHPQDDPARDPYQQARELIAQVNQMYQRGMTPNSPEVQRIMARVRQLQAQGDAIRNRRAG